MPEKLHRRGYAWISGAALLVTALGCSAPVAPQAAPAPAQRSSGKRSICNICGTTREFTEANGRPAAECPICKSRERHRLLLIYLEHELKLFHKKLDVLHFSPQSAEETVFGHQPNWRYMTSNYSMSEDIFLDLTDVHMVDNLWDIIIVYHILEHIPDDQKAMREMFRILRPGGRAFVQVPLELGLLATYEDPNITDPYQRIKHFGQHDHVRKYAAPELRQRLEAAGFVVDVVDYAARLDPKVVETHRLVGEFDPPMDQSIWVCTKPGPPPQEVVVAPPPEPARPIRPGTMPQ